MKDICSKALEIFNKIQESLQRPKGGSGDLYKGPSFQEDARLISYSNLRMMLTRRLENFGNKFGISEQKLRSSES